ncbi:MAG: sodium-dependent transporter, partial [Amphritea sp.]|nr:sodium-dependent transporter [Amphritea sp.]MBQ0784324.1 sodium-dependent transporter [Amphritea sp.]
VLVALAAWTSAISLMEPGVAWMVERFGLKRGPVCIMLGLVVWLLGIAALSSFNFGSGISLFGMNIFDFLDFITANVFLPLGGLFVACFAGWALKQSITRDELAMPNPVYYLAWSVVIRYIAPVAVAAIFILNLIEKLG